MSYSFGGKNTVEEFNDTATGVANCGAPADIDEAYRGNLTENSGACTVGGGQKKWAGLVDTEYDIWYAAGRGAHKFAPTNWAGIDCSGFVFRVIEAADDEKVSVSGSIGNYYVGNAFEDDKVYKISIPSDEEEKVKMYGKLGRGDLVEYEHHMTIIYSDRPTCDSDSCTYEIVHASGYNNLCYVVKNSGKEKCTFNRLVVVNEISDKLRSSTLKNPKGFGRIKLWE